MQQLNVNEQFPQDWIRMFTHLANLFFEQSKIGTETVDEATINIRFFEQFEEKSPSISAQLQWNGQRHTAQFAEDALETDEKELLRQKKRMYSHV